MGPASTDGCANNLNATNGILSVMDPRLEPDQFMQQLLSAHQAEDAFVLQPEDLGEEE
jgi:hypothetical protein